MTVSTFSAGRRKAGFVCATLHERDTWGETGAVNDVEEDVRMGFA